MLLPSVTLSHLNLSAIPLSSSAICSYCNGRKVPSSKPNLSCSMPILKLELDFTTLQIYDRLIHLCKNKLQYIIYLHFCLGMEHDFIT